MDKHGVIMSEQIRVDEFLTSLLSISRPLDSFEMPLLDAHGATLAEDLYSGSRLAMAAGTRIRATHIGLAASLGLNHLPTRPHPRVVVISAGSELAKPGSALGAHERYETNSWLLTTGVREAGAYGYRVHTIPADETALKAVIEDQLVRADLMVISGEPGDQSFELITRTLSALGEITTVDLAMENSGLHNFGVIGPDRIPVVTVPADSIAAYISLELLIRPMIRTMLGSVNIHRPSVKAKLERAITSPAGLRSYLRAILSEDGKSVRAIPEQEGLAALSDANALIAISAATTELSTGAEVNVVVLRRRYF